MVIQNVEKLNLLSNLSQNIGRFLGFSVILFLSFIFISNAQASGLPAPTLLVPESGAHLGYDRVWVGGVAFNGSDITILIDDQETFQAKTRNHKSGVGSFAVELVNLSLGSHKITSISRDSHGRTSIISNVLTINIEPKTPAPTIYKPVVNSDSGIERPFIVGNIQSGLEVKIVIDDKIVANISPEINNFGITSFAWQPDVALALGQHKIEAFASDKGKLSNNSEPIYWQVGKAEDKTADKVSQNESELPTGGDDTGISVIESKNSEQALTVTDSKKAEEKPIIPEKPQEPEVPIVPKFQAEQQMPVEPEAAVTPEKSADNKGKIDTGEVKNNEIAVNDQGDKIQEIAPGAVVKTPNPNNDEPGAGFKLNNSLIVGIAILVFLLLSMAVWYVQERKDKLGDKVVDMFKDKDSGKNDDLPPPPPPVF